MGTLEQDPAYISFLESKAAKPTESGSTQHCSLEYFPPPEKKKITTTPLLDFLRQRKAERQRLRDERREERRRKEQERKRLKDADRDRRRGTGKPDTGSSRDITSDSVLRVLRNPEHEKEVKDDNNRGGGMKESRDKSQQLGTKKREDDRQRNNRDKERERKEKQFQESRQRENKGQNSVKSYRDDRQKQMEIRAQRKLPDDQRRKTSFERVQGHVKITDSHQSHEPEKGQGPSKMSDTRRSQEFDRGPTKLSDIRRSQEFERNLGSSKTSDLHKSQEYDRQTHSSRDIEHRKHYQSSDQRKVPNERFQSHAKDSEKQNKESEHRKSYRDSDFKRNQGYSKDIDQKRNSYNIRTTRCYNETESKKTSSDHRIHFKEGNPKSIKESVGENMKGEKEDESKKWEQMGAKPKKVISLDATNKPESKVDKMKEQSLKPENPVKKEQNVGNSLESDVQEDDRENNIVEEKQESGEGGMKNDSEKQPKQKNSSESESPELSYQSVTENVSKDKQDSLKSEKQDLAEPEDMHKTEVQVEPKENVKPCTEHKYGAKLCRRRGSLDSSDHESEIQGRKGMSRSATGSDWSMDSKLKRNHSLDLEGNHWVMDAMQGEGILKSSTVSEKSTREVRKGGNSDEKERSTDASNNGTDGEHKRDPRVERRIRNKDRPSIEIYRPGMGRFSLQRKERERGSGSAPGTAGSSMEQESPSSSPSPTPTNTTRTAASTKISKVGNELRSMTFKRSVSREK
ncbi:myb-like protein X isoform X2 [Cryptotermes secundus]|nr:myb-like protein X isoform X2 [Cryptotermes secundus]